MTAVNQNRLAKELELSQTTVSRALANHPSINAETKAMVWNLAAQLGYKITSPSKSKATREKNGTTVIGIVIAIPKKHRGQTETSQSILKGIAERTASEKVSLDIVYQEPSAHNLKTLQKRIRQTKWQGCILIHPMAEDIVEMLSNTIPCVSVVENYRRKFIDSVDVDQIETVGAVVRRLYEKGHRKIGFVSWVYDVPTPWVYHRFGAYVENLYQLGLNLREKDVINIQPLERLGPNRTCNRIIDSIKNGTTAFVCAADHQAYRLSKLLTSQGLNIPADCTLTGFDGINPPANCQQIPTIRVPYDEIGRSAFHQLLHRIEFPTAPRRHVQVDGELFAMNKIHTVQTTLKEVI